MNKRIMIAIASLVVAALLVVLVLPYYLGFKAKQTLLQQQALLAKSPILSISKHTYKRGWFTSTETMEVNFKSSFLSAEQQKLPDNVRTILSQPVTIVNHVHHGLFAGSLQPVRAKVITEFQFSPETQQILARFFGQQTPITMQNTIKLSGDGDIKIDIPKFNYEELSGIKLAWAGLQSDINYSAGFQDYDNKINSPALNLILADKGEISYEGLQINTHTEDGKIALAFGNSKLALKKLTIQWHQGVSYDVRINDLLNFVSDLQIGAFINPTGSVPPSKIVLQDLYVNTDMKENGKWVNSSGQFGFDKLFYGQDLYGPLQIDVAAEHLDGQSLIALKNKLNKLALQNLTNEQLRNAIVEAARNEGVGLFIHDPLIKLNSFKLNMPEGLINIHGTIGLKGLQPNDMQQFGSMLRKIDSQMSYTVPQVLLENFAVGQARNLFTVDSNIAGEDALADIDQTIRLMVDSSIKAMKEQGYLTVDKGLINTEVKLNNGQLLLNNKALINEAEPEEWDDNMTIQKASDVNS